MKKIEEFETENETSQKDSNSTETEKTEIFQDSTKHRKLDDLTINFQISKNNEIKENSQINEFAKISSQNDEEISESKEKLLNQADETETEEIKINYENFGNNEKKAKYEDGTWKFF